MSTAMVHASDQMFGADSLERSDLDEIEATLSWGGDPIAVKHVPLGSTLALGETTGCHFSVPANELGSERVEIQAVNDGEMRFGAFALTLRVVPAGRAMPMGILTSLKESALGSVSGSFVLHAMVFASLALFLPSMGADDDASITRDQILAMQKYLTSAADREREQEEQPQSGDTVPGGGAGGTQALGESGAMGTPTSAKTNHHYSAKGNADPHDATLARERELRDAREGGMIGLLASAGLSDPNAPVAPWGKVLNGADSESHLGAMWGDSPGENWGIGGLGLSGVGEGGCPAGSAHCGEGVGLSDVGGLGHNLRDHLGTCVGPNCSGIGNGHSPLRPGHVPKGPRMRMCGDQSCGFEASGRLPAEVIQRIVRQNMGRYRACYESGLRGNPSLTGHVRVRFVIDRSGGVSVAQDGGSDIPDEKVRSCVIQNFYSLAFPAPQGGTVSVIYPIILTPSE